MWCLRSRSYVIMLFLHVCITRVFFFCQKVPERHLCQTCLFSKMVKQGSHNIRGSRKMRGGCISRRSHIVAAPACLRQWRVITAKTVGGGVISSPLSASPFRLDSPFAESRSRSTVVRDCVRMAHA